MAGCSKKQYAIMMNSGPEGQKLASKMGKMEQPDFNEAFKELINSDAATDATARAENDKWSPEEDEDYQDFDVTSDEDFDNNDNEYESEYDDGKTPEQEYEDRLKIEKQKQLFNQYHDTLEGIGADKLDDFQKALEYAEENGTLSEEQLDQLWEEVDKKIDENTQNDLYDGYGYLDPRNGQVVSKKYYEKYVKPNLTPEQLKEAEGDNDIEKSEKEDADKIRDLLKEKGFDSPEVEKAVDEYWDKYGDYLREKNENYTIEQFKKELIASSGDDKKEKPLHIQSLEKQVARNPQYKEIADSLTDNKDMNDAYFYAFKDAYEKHGYEPSNKHIADELEDAYFRLQDDYRERHGMNDSEWDWHGESAFEREYGTMSEFIDNGLEAHNRYFDNLGSANNQPQKRWSDDLEDNEYTKEYRSDVERMDPQKADAIAKAMEEYVAEKPQRGFINADQIKRYSEKLGLTNMDDDELSQAWYDVDNVGGLYEHGKPYDKGGRELGDARSAFIELINKEARDRRGGKTKEDALAKIKEWADEIGKYDLDDSRAYLTGQQGDYINRAVDKHGITKSELRALHPSVFGKGGYSQYGKEDEKSAENKLNYSPEMKKVKNAIKGLTLDSKEERRKLLLQMLDEIDAEE